MDQRLHPQCATRRLALQALVLAGGLGALARPGFAQAQASGTAPAQAVQLPAPGPRDTCPVCGMFVAPYPYWVATVLWRDGKLRHFDGAKDFFKYLLDLKKYEGGRHRADIQAMGVTDYYATRRIDAGSASYVVGSDVLGPMGHELVPHASSAEAQEFMADHKGRRVLRFSEVTAALLAGLDAGRF